MIKLMKSRSLKALLFSFLSHLSPKNSLLFFIKIL